MSNGIILTAGTKTSGGINITFDNDGNVCISGVDIQPAIVIADADSTVGTVTVRPILADVTGIGTSWNGEEKTLIYNWEYPNKSGLKNYPTPITGDIGVMIKSKYFLPYAMGGSFIDAPSDGKMYARKDGEWVEITSIAPEETTTMYYGYIEGLHDVDDITADMLTGDTVTVMTTQTLNKVAINAPRGSVIFALIPASSSLIAGKDDGVDGVVSFSENIHEEGTGANGKEFNINGESYKLYGEFNLVDAITYIYIN